MAAAVASHRCGDDEHWYASGDFAVGFYAMQRCFQKVLTNDYFVLLKTQNGREQLISMLNALKKGEEVG